jgi:peroxiredoxin
MNAPLSTTASNQSQRITHARKAMATLGLVALLAVPVVLLIALQRSTNPKILRTGELIPGEALEAIETGNVSLKSTSGRSRAFFFFRADCPRCRNEIPALNEAERRFGAMVDFVAIALGNKQGAEAFMRTHDVRMRVFVDERGGVGKLFGVSEVPALFLVNQSQRIQWVGIGEQPRREIFRRLAMLEGSGAQN